MLDNESTEDTEQKMKRLEKLLEDEISEIAKYIKIKLSFGIDIFNIQLPDTTIELKKIIYYILNKLQRSNHDNLILRQFLISYPEFLDTLKLRDQISDPKELLLKISQNLRKEEMYKDRVVFYNGQYGKSFYLILEGEVSVLLPYEYKLKLTDKIVLKYMYYLLQLREYELIRLMFENNRHVFNDLDYRENTLYMKLKACSERGLPNNMDTEKISARDYMQRYEYFSSLEKRQIDEAAKKDLKEKNDKKEQKENFKFRRSYFDALLRDNLRMRTHVEKKIDVKCFENDEDDEEVKRNKNFFYNEEAVFSIYKYFEVIKLAKGKCFGELALTKEGKKRNATIITTKNCIFGILQKEAYQAFIKDTMEKARKANVELLLKCRLFKGCNSEKFEAHLFSCFKLMKKNKGEYLFKQGDRRDFIYFLKKGEIQLELFHNCFYLETLVNNLGYTDEKFNLKDLIKSKQLEQFCKIKRQFKILILSDEVIGLEDHTTPPDYMYYSISGLCASYCEMFALDVKFFSKIMDEKVIRSNYASLVKERKLRLAERLQLLKNNVIMQQYNFFKGNLKYINGSDEQDLLNGEHKLKINKKIENHELIKPNEKINEKSSTKQQKNKINKKEISESEKKNEAIKSNIYSYKYKKTKKKDGESPDTPGLHNTHNTNSHHRFVLSSPTNYNKFRIKMKLKAPKRSLKLKGEINNVKINDHLINKIKKNNRSNTFNSTYSQEFHKNEKILPIINPNLKSQKGRLSLNRFSLKSDNLFSMDENQELTNKKRKSHNIKYINFGNIKIPKSFLRQSNILNTEIDKINEIIINNYEKVTPSSFKKSKSKFQDLSVNVPEYNSEEKPNGLYINTLNADFKKKFFPLTISKNNNTNYKTINEEDIVNNFEKK